MAKANKDAPKRSQINVKNVPDEVLGKIQHIANDADASNNEVYIKALTTYVERWEAKYGKIKLKPKTGSLDV